MELLVIKSKTPKDRPVSSVQIEVKTLGRNYRLIILYTEFQATKIYLFEHVERMERKSKRVL
jgi:hypothetical protein